MAEVAKKFNVELTFFHGNWVVAVKKYASFGYSIQLTTIFCFLLRS
jgi:hypothetical protein